MGPNASDLDELRILRPLPTHLAKLIGGHLSCPCPLVLQSWFWLAANAHDIEEKRRCLRAVLQLDAENEPATLGPLVVDHARPINYRRAGLAPRVLVLHSRCPQRNSNPRRRLERAVS